MRLLLGFHSRRSLRAIALIFTAILIAGCSKEKATAIKVGAEQFRDKAHHALALIEVGFKKGVPTIGGGSAENLARIASDLEKAEPDQITAQSTHFLMVEDEATTEVTKEIEKSFEELEQQYSTFAETFASLPEGSWFAAEAVEKAEKHCLKLTLQLTSMAKTLNTPGAIMYVDDRVALVQDIRAAKQIGNQERRQLRMLQLAERLVALRNQELKARDAAIGACLSGAQSGFALCKLIRDYDKMSVEDMLVALREALQLADDVGDGHFNTARVAGRLRSIEDAIRSDEHWRELLELKEDEDSGQ